MRPRVLALPLVTALITACGPAADPAPPAGATIDNCGVAVPAEQPPKRIFAAFHNAVELVHALGAGDRLVGTAYLDNPILPEFAANQARAKYFPDEYPSREEVLRLDPDLVVAGFTGAFTTEGLGTRAELRSIGIGSWLNTQMCPTEDGAGQASLAVGEVSLDGVYREITDLGRVLGTGDRAAAQVSRMKETLAATRTALAGVTTRPRVAVLNRPGGGGELRVFGGGDIVQPIIEAAGGEQVFADIRGRLARIGTEELIKRAPDVIVVPACCGSDVGPEGANAVIDALREDPSLANVPAVRDNRIYPTTFAELSPGVRNADAVAALAKRLHPDRFGR
ncbi:ABC transporter substrate-binding protein [Allokutzneria oryzae]|uniref:ABC transporter substrate-binding protein n=1 Tax=Allokutzneria oryzae TaxID=1378989 RepID=A0ABV6A314_9PSEU